MSMMKMLAEEMPAELKEQLPAKCSFCGENPPSAVWFGHDVVSCCRTCAYQKAPLLIADAASNSKSLDYDGMGLAANKVAGTLWRGLALAAGRRVK